MANKIQLKRSSVQNKVPSTTDVDLGELALNTYDGKLYTKKSDGTTETVVQLSVDSTVVKTTDSGKVTSAMIADGTIVNADINASAAIAGTKISPDFGSQNVATTGTATAASLIPTSSTAPTNGLYLPSANSVAISTGGSGKLFVNSNGDVTVGHNSSPYSGAGRGLISVNGSSSSILDLQTGTTSRFRMFCNGTTTELVNSEATGSLVFGTNNTERLRITSAGLVGVGTSSPGKTLDVNGESRCTVAATINNGAAWYTAGDPGGYLYLGNGIGTSASIESYTPSSRSSAAQLELRFKTVNTAGSAVTALTIDSSQRVGVGTTTPGYVLDVGGAGQTVPTINCFGPAADNNWAGGIRFASNNGTTVNSKIQASTGGLFFEYGGDERARIDSSGRLLVGTSSSRAAITGNEATLQVEKVGTGATGQALSVTDNRTEQFGPAFSLIKSRGSTLGSFTVVQNNDEIGSIFFIGTDGSKGVRGASIAAFVDGTPGANDMPGRLVFSTTADGASSPTERMRIASNGTVFITQSNTGTYGEYIDFSSGGYGLGIRNSSGGSAELVYFFSPNYVGGITTSGSTTSYLSASDYRLKENIALVTDGITRLQQLKPIRFNFIADPSKTVDGFIAHEVQAVVPEAVTGEKDAVDADGKPIYQGIDQSKLVPLLTAALQEAVAKIESLEARLTAAGI